ncbi:MAG: archaellin/type IV pilin N-terminal domain-containing protein, partial [Nitrososphaerales archaeon]
MRLQRKRRGVSEIVGVLMMLAIVITLGVLIFSFANGSMSSLKEDYGAVMSGKENAASEKFVVEQVAYSVPSLAVDGTSTNDVAGSSSSIATTLTTTSTNDVVVAYVSPADTGSGAPPSVSGIMGGGLTWSHRITTPAETYPRYYVPVTLTNNLPITPAVDGTASVTFSGTNSGTTSTLTTTNANDVIVVLASAEDLVNDVVPAVSSVTAAGLTFSQRSSESATTDVYLDEEVWYAVATATFSGTIHVAFSDSSGTLDDGAAVAFGVSNANTAAPWDPNAAVPAAGTAVSASAPTSSTLSTSNPYDMVVGFSGMMSSAAAGNRIQTAGAGYN